MKCKGKEGWKGAGDTKGKGKDGGKGVFPGYCNTCGEWGHTGRYCPKGQGKASMTGQLIDDGSSLRGTEAERQQELDDRWVPIHFEEITEIEESFFMNDRERNSVMYPKKYSRELMRLDEEQDELGAPNEE